VAIAAVDEVLRPRRLPPDHRPLATIRLVAPTEVSSPCNRSGDTALSATLAGAATTAWISLVRLSTRKCAFYRATTDNLLRLMQLGSTGLVCILGRGRRGDDRRIENCARDHLQSLRRQVTLHLLEQPLAQIVRFPNRPARRGDYRTVAPNPGLSALDASEFCGELSHISTLG
jgi:hypothetical protein